MPPGRGVARRGERSGPGMWVVAVGRARSVECARPPRASSAIPHSPRAKADAPWPSTQEAGAAASPRRCSPSRTIPRPRAGRHSPTCGWRSRFLRRPSGPSGGRYVPIEKRPDFAVFAEALADLGLRKRAGMIFTIPLADGVLGWLGLNSATQGYPKGCGIIHPVIGVRNDEVQRELARLRGVAYRRYSAHREPAPLPPPARPGPQPVGTSPRTPATRARRWPTSARPSRTSVCPGCAPTPASTP